MGRGASCRATAKVLECATSTVVVAVRRYQEGGRQGLRDRRERDGRAKVDERFRERLACVLEGTPEDWGWCRPTWTRELLCQELALRGQVRVSVATMGRTLASLGARLKAAKPVVECPWPSWKRQRRLLELKCLEVNGIHPPLPPAVLPQGNRVERVWLDLHANVPRNHRCRTMDQLMVRVHAYLSARNAQRSASPSLRRVDLWRTS
ncbi:helix-turn-helix domain-containing protein [Myxococcus virescens]|uniref:helix-turn-helix domain-containing protein n=1 Tax=Myxococcus virescens TaxID=83456 RepID=UPI003DA6BA67